jgi:hypothetical protein
LDKIFGSSDFDRFANKFVAALKSAGDPRTASYDPIEFRLVFYQDNKPQGILNLGNLFAEYRQVGSANQKKCLSDMVRAALSHLKEMPEEFEAATYDLRPRLWARATYEQLRLRCELSGHEMPDWPLEPIGEHLYLSLVYDLPESVRSISNDDLSNWNVSYWRAREVAVQNLQETEFVFVALGTELYASNTGDSYDATRIVLTEMFDRFEIQGQPIVMVPNRDTLLITGSESAVGQKMMLELAQQQLEQQPRPLIATPLTLDNNLAWKDWHPESNHPLLGQYQSLKLNWMKIEYAEQKQLLDQIHRQKNIDLFVANFSMISRNDDLHSYSVWTRGTPTLLPRTDYVSLVDHVFNKTYLVPLEELQSAVGSLMSITDYYPSRILVSEFPDDAQLDQLEPYVLRKPL